MQKFSYDYERPAVTVDLIVIAEQKNAQSHILLVERGKDPYKGRLALPGGFLNMNETGQQGAVREFQEECAASLPHDCSVEFFKIADGVNRDPRGRTISLVHLAMFEGNPFTVVGSDDAVKAVWIPLQVINNHALAFDHADIIKSFNEYLPWITSACDVCGNFNCTHCLWLGK